MENITTAIGSLMEIVSTMLDTVTGNPILCVLFATSFVGVAIGIVKSFKRV